MKSLLSLTVVLLLATGCQASSEDAYNSGADLNAQRLKVLSEEARSQCSLALEHRKALRAKYIADERNPMPDGEIEPFWTKAAQLQLGVCRLQDEVLEAERLAWDEQERRLGYDSYLRMLEAE